MMLVGFRGDGWGGGAFESRCRTPEAAAQQAMKQYAKSAPGPIREVVVTDFPRFACVLKLDGTHSRGRPQGTSPAQGSAWLIFNLRERSGSIMEKLIAKRDAAHRAYCKAHEKHLREHSYESEAHMQAMRKVWRGAEKLLADAYARMGQAKTLKEG